MNSLKIMKTKNNWISIHEKIPPKGIDVECITDDGSITTAFLCNRCGREWRDAITGYGIMITVLYWRYKE